MSPDMPVDPVEASPLDRTLEAMARERMDLLKEEVRDLVGVMDLQNAPRVLHLLSRLATEAKHVLVLFDVEDLDEGYMDDELGGLRRARGPRRRPGDDPGAEMVATIQQMGHAQHLPALVRCAAEAKEAKDEDLYQRLRTEIDRILPPQAPAPAAALVTP